MEKTWTVDPICRGNCPLVNELYRQIAGLKQELERVEKERDAAVAEIQKSCMTSQHICPKM